MAKKKQDDDGPRPIKITMTDEPPEPNPTLYAILRDGEKLKPGDPKGTLLDRLGAEVQAFFAEQTRVAKYRRTSVKGSITLSIAVVTGPDGSQVCTVESKTKGAKVPAGASMFFTDDDGELTGRPVEPLTEEMYKRERASADPKVGSASNL